MIVGVPKETKRHEYRVGLLPAGVEELTRAGHTVVVERGAGLGSGLTDESFEAAGARMLDTREVIWASSDLIVKVKEPQPDELLLVPEGQLVFTYFHFAADRALTEGMLASNATAIAYETLRETDGRLPLLTPMSEVAGRMSIQEGAKYLERPHLGRGILLGGVPGVEPGRVLVIGGGVVGTNAARVAAGFGAQVSVLDVNLDRLRFLDTVMPKNVILLFSDRHTLRDQLARADLVVGAPLVPGAAAPRLIERGDLGRMQPGAVLVDVAIDQGGIAETSRPTTHDAPTFVVDGIVHYCVANMPGAVGRTSTYALCNATLPYVLLLASQGLRGASLSRPSLVSAVNTFQGALTNRPVADAHGLPYEPYEP